MNKLNFKNNNLENFNRSNIDGDFSENLNDKLIIDVLKKLKIQLDLNIEQEKCIDNCIKFLNCSNGEEIDFDFNFSSILLDIGMKNPDHIFIINECYKYISKCILF